MCCKTLPEVSEGDMDAVKECVGLEGKHHGPPTCEMDLCIAKKKGVASEDGTIDMKALTADLAKDFKNDPELLEIIEKKCLNGDVSSYGLPEICELMKIRHCLQAQIVLNCKEFDSSNQHCNGVKDLVEECKKEF